jgi:hypothetical protein
MSDNGAMTDEEVYAIYVKTYAKVKSGGVIEAIEDWSYLPAGKNIRVRADECGRVAVVQATVDAAGHKPLRDKGSLLMEVHKTLGGDRDPAAFAGWPFSSVK